MDEQEKLPPELKEKLLEVELEAEKEANKYPRFDKDKAVLIGLLCLGLAFTLGIAMRVNVFHSIVFALIVGGIAFATAGFQRPKKR